MKKVIEQLITKDKIFCISFQRTGTTSVGNFFKEHGYKVAGNQISQSNEWNEKWYRGDYDAIFNSKYFKRSEVFEDDPWFFPEFYKFLFMKFKNAKFILFKRDPNKWFDSMVSHSNGMSLGNTFIHAKIYRREEEMHSFDSYGEPILNHLSLEGHREEYIKVYNRHIIEVEQFFKAYAPDSLITCNLEDPEKWTKLGALFNIKVDDSYNVHSNRSK